MENLELFEKMLAKYIEALKYHNLVRSLNHYSFKCYPNLEVDLDAENKKIAESGLVLISDGRFIYLMPTHNNNALKLLFDYSEGYELASYNLMETYKFMLSDSTIQGELNGLDISLKYRKFDSKVTVNYKMDVKEVLEEMLLHLDRLTREFKEDYEALLNAESIYNNYVELFNEPEPTGDFEELLDLLKENNVNLDNLKRLEIVDGKAINFTTLKLPRGRIIYTRYNSYAYEIFGDGNYEDDVSFTGLPSDFIVDLEDKISELIEIKEEVLLADRIIEVLKRIKNVNYYIK